MATGVVEITSEPFAPREFAMKTQQFFHRDRYKGFTLVELAVIVVIIGVLASFGVPRYVESAECSKASEAFGYLSAVRSAQERFQGREGMYADDIALLDIQVPKPKYFHIGTITAGNEDRLEDSWSLALTRAGTSAGYGPYTIVFTQQGYDATHSTIPANINPIAGASGRPDQGD